MQPPQSDTHRMTPAEEAEPLRYIPHHLFRPGIDHSKVPGCLKAHARQHKHCLLAIQCRAKLDVGRKTQDGEVEPHEHVQRARRVRARQAGEGVRVDRGVHQVCVGLDLGVDGLEPFFRGREDAGEGSLDEPVGTHEAVAPDGHAVLEGRGDPEGVVQRYPAEAPAGEEEALGQARESQDRHRSGERGHRVERRGPRLGCSVWLRPDVKRGLTMCP
jgi:hypothetical protein